MNKELLKLITVRIETVKLECLKNTDFKDTEFQLKEINIAQNQKYREILSDRSEDDWLTKSIAEACRAVMVEPKFFTDKELENLNGIGEAIMNEIFMKIPTIGMNAKEKKHYLKKVEELAKKQIKDQSEDEDEVTEEKK